MALREADDVDQLLAQRIEQGLSPRVTDLSVVHRVGAILRLAREEGSDAA